MTRCGANPPRSLGFHHLSRGAFQKLSKVLRDGKEKEEKEEDAPVIESL